jgi:hypothetical protein
MGVVHRCGVIVLAAAAACSSYGASSPEDDAAGDGGVPPPPAGSDSGGDDAAIDAPTEGSADAGDDAALATNLLGNPGFEMATCESWASSGTAQLGDSTNAHAGALACRVCGDGTIWDVHQTVPENVQPGFRYAASAWVRAETDGTPAQVQLSAGGTSNTSALTPLTLAWTRLDVKVVEAISAGGSATLQIAAGGTACIVVDDASVTRVP